MKYDLNFVQLNEINFDVVNKYISAEPNRYLGLEKLLKLKKYTTFSEKAYELLEPWIQWASVNMEKTFTEHKIFRLGDAENADHIQIFEKVEELGYSVGCISPMNAVNRLKNPTFFIPDPWTNTKSDSSFVSRELHEALRQAVNDNSQEKLSFRTILAIIFCFVLYARKRNIFLYTKLFLKRKKRWNKALFLDLFLTDLYIHKYKTSSTKFGTLFLNAFAHIQHHYFLNSKYSSIEVKNTNEYISTDDDPVKDAVEVYDVIIKQLLTLNTHKNIFATGLRQLPVKKKIIYYRLKNHDEFLTLCGLKSFVVEPRMTRDFKISFHNARARKDGERILSKLTCNGEKLFGVIDKRADSTFCTLTYSLPLTDDMKVDVEGQTILLKDHFVFVAYKNGEHDGQGYLFTDLETTIFNAMEPQHHVKFIGTEIVNYFKNNKDEKQQA